MPIDADRHVIFDQHRNSQITACRARRRTLNLGIREFSTASRTTYSFFSHTYSHHKTILRMVVAYTKGRKVEESNPYDFSHAGFQIWLATTGPHLPKITVLLWLATPIRKGLRSHLSLRSSLIRDMCEVSAAARVISNNYRARRTATYKGFHNSLLM